MVRPVTNTLAKARYFELGYIELDGKPFALAQGRSEFSGDCPKLRRLSQKGASIVGKAPRDSFVASVVMAPVTLDPSAFPHLSTERDGTKRSSWTAPANPSKATTGKPIEIRQADPVDHLSALLENHRHPPGRTIPFGIGRRC